MRNTTDRLYSIKIATRFSDAAQIRNEQTEKAYDLAINYLAMSYNTTDTTLVQAHPMYALLKALTIGYLHSAGEEEDKQYEEYVKMSDIARHMSSTYRPDLDPNFKPMVDASFDVKEFSGVERYALKVDLSKVYIDFADNLSEEARLKLESDSGLFGSMLYDNVLDDEIK